MEEFLIKELLKQREMLVKQICSIDFNNMNGVTSRMELQYLITDIDIQINNYKK